jgi:translation initiation factor IF-1
MVSGFGRTRGGARETFTTRFRGLWAVGMAGGRERRGRREIVAVTGVVEETLPRGLYRVVLENQRRVLAHASRIPARNYVRVLVGDRVCVELSPVDQSRGRITRRLA